MVGYEFRITSYNVCYTKLLRFPNTDGAIMCAAVADYRPKFPAQQKIKRQVNDMTIELEANDDIAACLGEMKHEGQVLVGFALETQDEQST